MDVHTVLADVTASVTEFKKNPSKVVEQSNGRPLAIMNRNRADFYCIPAATYEALLDRIDDLELNAMIDARAADREIVGVAWAEL